MEQPDYRIVKNGAAFYTQSQAGYLRIIGHDNRDFLQRQTTNDLKLLEPGKVIPTVLTSPTARILDVFYLFVNAKVPKVPQTSNTEVKNVLADDILHVITLPTLGLQTTRYLQRRVFFMDKVTVINASGEFIQIDLLGPQVSPILQDLGVPDLYDAEDIIETDIADIRVTIFKHNPQLGLGYRLVVPADSISLVETALISTGAFRLNDEGYAVLRVEAGLPAVHQELSEDFTPLETNLDNLISQSKGCFTGQEVISRQINYGKVTRRMVGLLLDQPVTVNSDVIAVDTLAGKVTSTVLSPDFGPIALAIVKRPYDQPGTSLTVNTASGFITARVTDLPFNAKN